MARPAFLNIHQQGVCGVEKWYMVEKRLKWPNEQNRGEKPWHAWSSNWDQMTKIQSRMQTKMKWSWPHDSNPKAHSKKVTMGILVHEIPWDQMDAPDISIWLSGKRKEKNTKWRDLFDHFHSTPLVLSLSLNCLVPLYVHHIHPLFIVLQEHEPIIYHQHKNQSLKQATLPYITKMKSKGIKHTNSRNQTWALRKKKT